MSYNQRLLRHLVVAGIFLLYGICPSPALAANMKVLSGHVPTVVSSLTSKGRLAATNELQLAIGLPLRDPAGLDQYLAQIYDPASPHFHQYLTPEEAAARFGPTPDDYEAVKDFARTNGLTVTTTYNNRLVLDVTGPAAAVENAFHITLRTYRHPTEARDFFAPDTEPTVDAQLPVADIQGLSNYSRPRSRLHRMNVARANVAPKGGSAPDGSEAYFGNDFRNAYAPGTTLTGAGQTLGLFEADGFYANDIATYAGEAGNGRTSIVIQTVTLDGFSGIPTTGSDSGNGEVSLDIEMAMAMAPGLAKIVVYEGNPNNFIQNDILNSMLAGSNTVKNLSCSWGWNDGPSTTTDAIFKNMSAAGQSFFNAAGDSDAFTTGARSVNGVDNTSLGNAPSSSPYITQVGGTMLKMNGTGGTYASETVWNWNYDASAEAYVGTSGGISSHYTIPSWQTNINMPAREGSASYRNIPDVALTADDIFVVYGNGSTSEFGGTSCAAPLWAGFNALVNQQAVANGKPLVGFINPALYSIASGANYASCFHDVTTGSNTWSSSPTLFYATNGYDLCTGLGTPAGTNLINALAPPGDPLVISTQAGTAAGVAGGPFTISSGNLWLTNTGSASLAWSLVNTSTWLTVSATSGTLAAQALINLSCQLTAAASNLVTGTYTTDLAFSNKTSHVTQTRLFTLQVSQPLLVSPANGFTTSGPNGGPFDVTSQNFTLTNQSGSSLFWNIVNSSSWLNVSPSNGTLAGGAETTVTVSLTAAADNLAIGEYSADLLVTNFSGLAADLSFTLDALDTNQPIVVNGGFEDGDLTGWTLNGTTKNFVTSSSGFVHSGSYGLALGQEATLGYLYQTLTTTPGQNYLLSLWLANTLDGANTNQFLVQWNGTTLFNQTNLPTIAWTNLQFVVTATSTNTVLQFGFEDIPFFLALDDVSVVPLSPPTFNVAQPAATGFNLTWATIAGQVYQVQYTTNLTQPNWIDLGNPLTATTNTLTLQDTDAITASPSRFYRVVEQP
jgi:subtilase family serine protease